MTVPIRSDTRLHASIRVFEHPVEDQWVLFAPDHPGLPIVVEPWVRDVLHGFDGGAEVGGVVAAAEARGHRARKVLPAIEALSAGGFLQGAPAPARYRAEELVPEGQELSIWLHVNNYCNLDCDYCFVEKDHAAMTREVMAATISRIVCTARKHGTQRIGLKFGGGEPTLSVPAMEWFHDRLLRELEGTGVTLSTGVVSNGTVASDRLIAFLRRPRVALSISLDGFGATSHDRYRVFVGSGEGSWDVIMRNVDRFLANGIVPGINATISEQTSATLPELVRWIFGRGLRARLSVVRQPTEDRFREWGVVRLRTSRDARPDIRDAYAGLNRSMKAAFEAAFAELEKPEVAIDLRNGLRICELTFDQPSFTSCCGIGSNHVVIQEDGRLASCPMTLREANVEPSDDLVTSTRETFASSPMEHDRGGEKSCLDCRWFPVCVGGCPVNNERMTGRAFTVSPLHEFYEYVIPRYVVFFGRKLLQEERRRRGAARVAS